MSERFRDFLLATGATWQDVVDILIVAFIIYQLLQFLRGTHAVQVALGGVVLAALYWVSRYTGLETVNWLISTFVPFLVFGVIVLFQPEIRKVLARIGRGPLFGTPAGRRPHEVVEEIVLAATTLSSQQTGAILVIERTMGLRNYIETGIALEARVTYDLLMSIFNKSTPLHDGAAIIQGDRVAAAACFLPLTVNAALSRALGSRHRAAIGVTEDTDAVAVVVSEETGTISFVEHGAIQRGLDGTALRAALLSPWLSTARRAEPGPTATPAATEPSAAAAPAASGEPAEPPTRTLRGA